MSAEHQNQARSQNFAGMTSSVQIFMYQHFAVDVADEPLCKFAQVVGLQRVSNRQFVFVVPASLAQHIVDVVQRKAIRLRLTEILVLQHNAV